MVSVKGSVVIPMSQEKVDKMDEDEPDRTADSAN